MKRRTMIADLKVGDTCETDLLLLRMTQRVAKTNGNPFVDLVFSDGLSIVIARKFNTRVEDLEEIGIAIESVVRVVLAVDNFYGNKNYIVCDIWAEYYYDEYIQEFLPKASINVPQSFSNLVALIRLNSGIFTERYAPISRLAEQVLISNRDAFCHSAGGETKHHNRIGGLLEHSLSVATEASRIADHHPDLDRELLVTGAALHDIGKIHELYTSPCGNIEYRENRLAGGHPLIGMNMIDDTLDDSKWRFDPDRVIMLKHIIGAHHGRHGDKKVLAPMILEARIVQLLDSLDASLDSYHSSIPDCRGQMQQISTKERNWYLLNLAEEGGKAA